LAPPPISVIREYAVVALMLPFATPSMPPGLDVEVDFGRLPPEAKREEEADEAE
jgi:hypothetical protein